MNTTRFFVLLPGVAVLLGGPVLVGCSDASSESSSAQSSPSEAIDSSYLDELAHEQAPEPEPEPEESADDAPVEITQSAPVEEEDREWVAAQGSRSTLGKTRDRARDLRNRIQGGQAPEGGVADVYSDEEYANAAGYRWDMPEQWQMAVPVSGRFAEMIVPSPLGNALVGFTKENDSVADITRSLSSMLVTDTGGRNRPKTTKKTILGFPVTILDMTGTYIDPMSKGGRNESPFYAMHAAIIELPDTRIVINMWGPEDTVAQNTGRFDAMLEQMSAE